MPISGYRELSQQLHALGAAAGGNALRASARNAMEPALQAARAAAPVASPPYGPYETRKQPLDPYPKKTYKGRMVAPGFTQRTIAIKTALSSGRNAARVVMGVAREAFYAINFIEFGTSKFPRRPWLEPAFRASIAQVDKILQSELRTRIDAAVRRAARKARTK